MESVKREKGAEGTVITSGFPENSISSDPSDWPKMSSKIFSYLDSDRCRCHYMVVYNCFTPVEMMKINQFTEYCGYESLRHLYHPEYRNNERIIVRDEKFADIWFQRLLPHILRFQEEGRTNESDNTTEHNSVTMYDPYELEEEIPWYRDPPYKLNSQFRCCKYQSGGVFMVHEDSSVLFTNVAESRLTVMAYFNEVPEENGGATRFFRSRTDTNPVAKLQPKAGSVVIFPHTLLHDGELCKHPEKIVLRSDVLFSLF